MLRLLAIAPLLFVIPLLADEDDRLQAALSKRIELTERMLAIAKRLRFDPAVVLDAEIELVEARLDAAPDNLERMKWLQPLVQRCRDRMEDAQRRGRTGPEPAERARFVWLRARLRALRAAYEDTDELDAEEGAVEGRRKYFRLVAREALEVAQKCDERLQAEWDAGTAAAGYRLQAIDDIFFAQMALAENDDDRRAATAARLKTLTEIYPIARYNADVGLGARYFPFGEVRDAWLRARIAVELEKGDAASAELQQLREVRLELLMTELRFLLKDIETRAGSISYCKLFVEAVLECPPEYMIPSQRRLLASQLSWVLSLVRERLPNTFGQKHRALLELELAELAVLETKVEIWDLRRSAIEPPPPKVIPGD